MRRNHETNVGVMMPDAVSAPSVRAGERRAGGGGCAWFNQSFHVVFTFHQPVITSLAILAIIGRTESCLKGDCPPPPPTHTHTLSAPPWK